MTDLLKHVIAMGAMCLMAGAAQAGLLPDRVAKAAADSNRFAGSVAMARITASATGFGTVSEGERRR